MKSSIRWILVASLLAPAFVTACTNGPPASARETVTALRGTVTDATGAPLAGVAVHAGSASATSRADGVYDLRLVAGDAVITYERAGFVRTFERVEVVDGSPTQLDVTMLPMATAIMLDASAGGTVTGARGASIVAPPSAFVSASGTIMTGMVAVHLTPIDPSAATELGAAPGDFTGIQGGSPVPLESLGMLDITVESGGERLQVAPGQTLEIHLPVAAGAGSPDAMAPVWSFDETTGTWTDEGMATFDAVSGTYVATTHHMSVWNVDKPYLATCLCGTVVERGVGPLPGAHIDAAGVDYFGQSSATADANGRFCVAVRKSSTVNIAAYHASGGGVSRQVTSGAADTNVPPTPGDARCVDVGTFEVERDVFVDPTGAVTTCSDVNASLFAGPCGQRFFGIFRCFAPSGACTIHTDTTNGASSTTYANGSHTETTGTAGGGATIDYYGPAGQRCAHSSTTDAASSFQYVLMDGSTIVVTSSEAGDLTLQCDDGTSETLTTTQQQALDACNPPTDGSGGGTMCTIDTTLPGACTTDGDCTTSGEVCCAIPNSSFRTCLAASVCAML